MGNFGITTLDNIAPDQQCIIKQIDIDNKDFVNKLMNLGLVKNTYVKALYISPLGNVKAYYVRGSVIALRNEDAKKITVYNSNFD